MTFSALTFRLRRPGPGGAHSAPRDPLAGDEGNCSQPLLKNFIPALGFRSRFRPFGHHESKHVSPAQDLSVPTPLWLRTA